MFHIVESPADAKPCTLVQDMASYRKYYSNMLPGEHYTFAEFINHIQTHGSSVGKLLTVDWMLSKLWKYQFAQGKKRLAV